MEGMGEYLEYSFHKPFYEVLAYITVNCKYGLRNLPSPLYYDIVEGRDWDIHFLYHRGPAEYQVALIVQNIQGIRTRYHHKTDIYTHILT